MAFKLPPILVPIRGKDEYSSQLAKLGSQVKGAGAGIAGVGKALTASITLPIVTMGVMAIKTGADFQQAMNKVGAVSQTSGEELEKMSRLARDMGKSTIFSASDAADAMTVLRKAGMSVNDTMAATPGIMQLAAAGEIGVAEAAAISENALGGFNIAAGRMNEVNDMLVHTTQNSEISLAELGEGIRVIAPLASSMGLSLQETSAALGVLANEGLKGSEAAGVLRQGLAKLANPASSAVEVFKRLKINKADLIDSAGNVRGLTQTLSVLEKAGATSTDILEIFGTRAGPGMTALLKGGSAKLKSFTTDIQNAAGNGGAADIANKKTEGFNGALAKLGSSFDELKISIANSGILDFATRLVEKVGKLVDWISSLNPIVLKMGVALAAVAAVTATLVWGIGPLVSFVSSLIVLFANPVFIAGLTAIKGLALSMSAALGPVLLIIAAFLIWANVIRMIAASWDNIVATFSSFEMFVKTMKFFLADLLGPVAKFVGLGESTGASGTATGAGVVAGAAQGTTNTNNASVAVRFDNPPPGMRAEVVGGQGTIDSALGLLVGG